MAYDNLWQCLDIRDGGVEVDDAGAQQEAPIQHRVRDEYLAPLLEPFQKRCIQAVQILIYGRRSRREIGWHEAECGDTQLLCEQLQLGCFRDAPGKHFGQRDVVRDLLCHADAPGLSQPEPYLQRPEATRVLGAVLEVIQRGLTIRLLRRMVVGWVRAERRGQVVTAAHEDTASLKR